MSVQAQTTSTSSGNEAYKGIENTLLDFKDDVIETVSDVKDKADDILDDIKDGIEKIAYLEKFMRGDIRLLMLSIEENSKFNYSGIKIFTENGFDLYTRNEDNTSSLYIEFDWDNRAQKMVGKGDAFDSHIGFLSTDAGGDIGKFTNKAHSSVQFTDKESYWYVPLKAESGNTMFIKFNAKQMAVESLKLGAYEFITKPFATEQLLNFITRALENNLIGLNPNFIYLYYNNCRVMEILH